jgi:hypothetical protein
MTAVQELLRTEADGTISFGDYTLKEKKKVDDFEFRGDLYKVKSFHEITKLERNGIFLFESVPGSLVENFDASDRGVAFKVTGDEDLQLTLGLEPDSEYEVFVEEAFVGKMTTNLSGKLCVGVEECAGQGAVVEVIKCS